MGKGKPEGKGKPAEPVYSIVAQSAEKAEGDGGTTAFTFTVTRTSAKKAGTIDYTVTGAEADDFAGGNRPSGTVKFAKGETEKTITILVAGDILSEGDETFTVALLGSSNVHIDPAHATATGTIQDDENAPPTGIPDTGTGLSVAENTVAGFEVATLIATDPDGDPVSYYLKVAGANGPTDGNFTINATTGVVTTARAFDYEADGASLSFTAVAVDSNGGEDSGTYTVPITDVAGETQLVDFEGTTVDPLPFGYAGFIWESSNASGYGGPPSDVKVYGGHPGGYNIAEGNEIAWNAYGARNVEISHIDGNFNLISMDLLNYFYGANGLVITGYDGDVLQHTMVVDITEATSLTSFTFNWYGIDTIKIEATVDGGFYAMDNILINEDPPPPDVNLIPDDPNGGYGLGGGTLGVADVFVFDMDLYPNSDITNVQFIASFESGTDVIAFVNAAAGLGGVGGSHAFASQLPGADIDVDAGATLVDFDVSFSTGEFVTLQNGFEYPLGLLV